MNSRLYPRKNDESAFLGRSAPDAPSRTMDGQHSEERALPPEMRQNAHAVEPNAGQAGGYPDEELASIAAKLEAVARSYELHQPRGRFARYHLHRAHIPESEYSGEEVLQSSTRTLLEDIKPREDRRDRR